MPRKDGTGPIGAGSMTGRGFGSCAGGNTVSYGAGLGQRSGLSCRRGFGRGFGSGIALNQNSSKTQKEMLQEQKDILKSRLDVIDKQLDNL